MKITVLTYIRLWGLYVIVPAIFKRTPEYAMYFLLGAMVFGFLVSIPIYRYQKSKKRIKDFWFDICCMTIGIVFLYVMEYCFYRGTGIINFVLYGVAIVSYLPSICHTKE